MANNLTTYRYLFNHNSALGLLVLEGVPHPEQYGDIKDIIEISSFEQFI